MNSTKAIEINKPLNYDGKGAEITVSFDDSLFFADSAVYNHSIARLSAVMSTLCYALPGRTSNAETCGARAALDSAGFCDPVFCPQAPADEVDCFFARKALSNGSTLVICGALGSHYGQWYSNFDSGTDTVHKGFKSAADFVSANLKEYLARFDIPKQSLKLLLTGHSRGAAAANLLAAELIKSGEPALKENIFTYTFATPCPVKQSAARGAEYDRIFNFVNEADFVTRCMPREWGYTRFGTTLALPAKGNAGNDKISKTAAARYADFNPGGRWCEFPKGAKTVNTLFAALTGSVTDVEGYYNKKFSFIGKKISVHEFFEISLCAIVGHDAGTKENTDGTVNLLKASLLRPLCSPVFRKIADFFVINEGLGGATNGKLGDCCFSCTHDISTYCAFLLAAEDDFFKKI